MNIEEYISSGIIELIALGQASEEEIQQFRQLAIEHPELQKELEETQDVLNVYASSHAAPPPAGLQDKIWAELEQAVPTQAAATVEPTQTSGEARVIPMQQNTGESLYPWMAAASIVLLIGVSAMSAMFYSKWQTAEKELASLVAEREYYANQFDIQQASVKQYETELAMVSRPNTKIIGLKGVGMHPEAYATVYFNTETKEVFLKPQNLPTPPSDKQYQLWAIVDGKPVDAGVFNMGEEGHTLSKMKSFEGAQAFAITMEKMGGSAVPTMEEMYVIGNV